MFDTLPDNVKQEIIQDAIVSGSYSAAKKWGAKVEELCGLKQESLRVKLYSLTKDKRETKIGDDEERRPSRGRAKSRHQIKRARKLSPDEIALLGKLERGEVGLEEVSRVVARQALERFLKYPDDKNQLADLFRTEMLRIKQQEVQDRSNWAMEFVNRMFMGKLPTHCEKCGNPLFQHSELKAIEGEVIESHVEPNNA